MKFLLKAWPFTLLVPVFLLNLLLPGFPGAVDSVYSGLLYPVITLFITTLFNWIPFSLTEISIIIIIIAIPISILLCILRKWRWKRFFFFGFGTTAFIYAWFYLAWGFNYHRQPLLERLALAKTPIDSLVFRNTLGSVLEEANAAYLPSETIDKNEIDREIELGFQRVANLLRIELPAGQRKPKTLLFNFLLNKTLTNGFFSPVFHEIHINSELLPVEYPFTLAHEKSHQMGIANEAEANFLAYLVCTSSDHPFVQYSAKLDVLGEFLGRARRSLADYPKFRKRVSPEIVADFRKIRDRWRNHVGAVSEVSRQAYDNYLKVNNIAEGVDNYRGVVEMVILWRMAR